MNINFLALLLAALSTLVVGFIWYNPKVFGNIWMKETGITMNPDEKPNMLRLFGTSVLYAFFIAFTLQTVVIHQFGVLGLIGGDETKALPSYVAFMKDYGNEFRYFGHGVLHGFFTGLLMILPVIGTNSLYEKRSWKYVLISGGFWIVCFMLMGGIICAMK